MMGRVPPLAALQDTFMTVMLVAVLIGGYIAVWVVWRKAFRGRGPQDNELVAEPLNRSGRDLAEELWELEGWLRRRQPELGWTRVALTEVDLSSPGAPAGPERSPEEFAPRFSEILAASQREAVALEARGVAGERLLVAVTWASEPAPGERRRARLPVTVRFHAADNLDTIV